MGHASNPRFRVVSLAIGLTDGGASRSQQRKNQRCGASRSLSRSATGGKARIARPAGGNQPAAPISDALQRRRTIDDNMFIRLRAGALGIATSPRLGEKVLVAIVQTMAGVLRVVSETYRIGDSLLSTVIFCFLMFLLRLAVWTGKNVDGMRRRSR
jgi:hypothetical protein